MVSNFTVFLITSIFYGVLLACFYGFGAVLKKSAPKALGGIPNLFLGILLLFSLIYCLTFVGLYVDGFIRSLPFFFLIAILSVAILSRTFRAVVSDQSLIRVCLVFSAVLFGVLSFQFHPYVELNNDTPRNNFVSDLPVDSLISLWFLQAMLRGELLVFGDWLGSDRPPLFSGAIQFFNILFASPSHVYLLIGVALQSIIVPVVAEIASRILKRRLAIAELVFVSFCVVSSPIFIHNIAYLWPKIIAATFLLMAAFFLFLNKKITVVNAVLSGLSMLFAFLSHGGSSYAIIGFAVVYLFGVRRAIDLLYGLLIGIIFILGAIPWIYYQKVIQPPGDRLVKWHLLGQIDIVPLSVSEVFHAQYLNFTMVDLWDRLVQSFEKQFLTFMGPLLSASSIDELAEAFTIQSFFFLPLAIGLIVVCALFGAVKSRDALMLLAVTAAVTLVWFILPFKPAQALHEGTYFIAFSVITVGIIGALNLTRGRQIVIIALILSGLFNLAMMNLYRSNTILNRTLGPYGLYRIVAVSGFEGGSDFAQTRRAGVSVMGSYILSDADLANFVVTAVGGHSIYYLTGPNADHQILQVYANDELILEMNGEAHLEWTKLNLGEHEQIIVKVDDGGKGFGQWSAIALAE